MQPKWWIFWSAIPRSIACFMLDFLPIPAPRSTRGRAMGEAQSSPSKQSWRIHHRSVC